MIFKHTAKERGMWRGWLKNGQSVEIVWGKRGWEFGGGVHIHIKDSDCGDRMIFLKFWKLTVVLPLGIVGYPWPAIDGPQWSAYASKEFGLMFHWGLRRWQWHWPWDWYTLAYEKQLIKGDDWSWVDVLHSDAEPYSEAYAYTYTLRSGGMQERTATVSKRRHVLTWRAFKALGWPRWSKESIKVQFSEKIGEESGSWKGGCTGCNYDLLPGETMEHCLRRMELERKF